MKDVVISHYFTVLITFYIFDHIYCDVFDSDTNYWSTTPVYTRDFLTRGLITDKYSETYCVHEHRKCLDSNNQKYRLIGAWDIFNSRWKFHTVCEIKNSKCLLDKTAYRYDMNGYNIWILV